MAQVRHELKLQGVRDLLPGNAHKKIRVNVARAIGKGLAILQRHHIKNEMIRRKGKTQKGTRKGSTKLFYRTGTLAKSYRIHHIKNRLQGSYGSHLKRAAKLEEGGIIRPKGKALAIPMPGVKGWPREYPKTGEGALFFFKSEAGKPMLGRKDGDGVRAMFSLVPQVKLPPRPTLQRTIDKKKPKVYKLVEAALAKGLGE